MNAVNISWFIVTLLVTGYLFILLCKPHAKLSEQRMFSLALDVGQMASFAIGMMLYLVFPLKFAVSGVINIWIGGFIGTLFCSRNGWQLLSGGFFSGGHAAIMGTMVGAATVKPEICGLLPSKLPVDNPELVVGMLSVLLLCGAVLLVKSMVEDGM